MNCGSPLTQDPCLCPDEIPAKSPVRPSFSGPFRFVTACLEKTGKHRKNRWCLMFITDFSMIISPVSPPTLHTDQKGSGSAGEPKQGQSAPRPWFHHDSDSEVLERMDNLVRQCHEFYPDKVIVAEHDADVIPLDTIKEIVITRVRSSGRYSRLLSWFSWYPAEPANARYHVNFQLVVMTGTKSVQFITPLSFELKQVLREQLGERVHEIPDEFAPLL